MNTRTFHELYRLCMGKGLSQDGFEGYLKARALECKEMGCLLSASLWEKDLKTFRSGTKADSRLVGSK